MSDRNLIERIAELCDRWQITEFSLFGSVLRDDFRPDSDIDVLVSFAPTAQRGLTETLQIRDELGALFGHPVDLLVKATIERSDNGLRHPNILNTARVIYPSPQS
jgi:predicted nucleotidyltransferase